MLLVVKYLRNFCTEEAVVVIADDKSKMGTFDAPLRCRDPKLAEPTDAENLIARQIVDAAFAVHRTLGPGLLESVYEQCLACELGIRGLSVER